jgi:hypothetical protein
MAISVLNCERLVRRIEGALASSANIAMCQEIATTFEEACRATNHRLRQCEAMINAGDPGQAIQLAETNPNLLDVVTQLEFRDVDRWREFCQANSLATAEPIDAACMQKLNSAYSRGIRSDHPLYQQYRQAVMTRDDGLAVQVLRSIHRLNPGDANAAAELDRLDQKLLDQRLAALNDLVAEGTPAQVAAEVQSIKSADFAHRPSGPIWVRAMDLHCQHLVEEAENLRMVGNYSMVLALLDEVETLAKEVGGPPSTGWRTFAMDQRAWADDKVRERRRKAEFHGCLNELTRLLALNEEKDVIARKVNLAEIKDDYEALHRTWREITEYAMAVPEELQTRFKKRTRLLAGEIHGRGRRRVFLIASASLALLLVIGLAGWIVLRNMENSAWVATLDEAIEARQFRAVERIVGQTNGPVSRGGESISLVLGRADTFIKKEEESVALLEKELLTLPKIRSTGNSAQRLLEIRDQWYGVTNVAAMIAPDFEEQFLSRLTSFQNRWEKLLADEEERLNDDYRKALDAMDAIVKDLNFRNPLKGIRKQLAELSALESQLTDGERLGSVGIEIQAELRQRKARVSTRVKAFSEEMRKYDRALQSLTLIGTLEEFIATVDGLSQLEFSSDEFVSAAQRVTLRDVSAERLLEQLVGEGTPGLVEHLRAKRPGGFLPAKLMPAEATAFKAFNREIAEFFELHRWQLNHGDRLEEWITKLGLQSYRGWRLIDYYAPESFPDRLRWDSRQFGIFGSDYRLQDPVRTLTEVIDKGPVKGGEVWQELKLDDDLAEETAILPLLETIVNSKQGSPVFRAWLFSRLTDLTKFQPYAWGAAYSPSLINDRRVLNSQLGDLDIHDCLIPERSASLAPKAQEFLNMIRSNGYAAQARGLHRLTQVAWEAGLNLIGYVAPDGAIQLGGGGAGRELWSFAADGSAELMVNQSGKPVVDVKTRALTPLFMMGANRNELLERAGIDPLDPLFSASLPPLFRRR